jgi:hypothetical protein
MSWLILGGSIFVMSLPQLMLLVSSLRRLRARDRAINSYADLITAKDVLIAALERKADALENLVSEQEKTLNVYRKFHGDMRV